MSLSTDVALRKTMQEYVDSRNHVLKMYEDGRRLLSDAEFAMRESCQYGISGSAQPRDNVDEVRRSIDAQFWRETFKRTGVTQLMDAQASKELQTSLEKQPPAFTRENIQTQYLSLSQEADMMFRRGIVNTFHRMDPDYWTNNNKPYEIGRRSILNRMFDTWSTNLRVNYNYSAEWNDIDRVIHVLDFKEHTPHGLETKLNSHFATTSEPYEDEYFQIKGFRNGNAHLLIKRDDLIGRINREIAAYYNATKLEEAA